MPHGKTRRTLTPHERQRLQAKVARIRRDAERAERIGIEREMQGFDRMMRQNGGTL